MYDDPILAIKSLFLPLISAQLLMVVVVYLAVVRKRIASEYKLYICFLLCLIFFQVGPIFQKYLAEWKVVRDMILYSRVSLLFGLGMPALFLANMSQCGLRLSSRMSYIPFFLGCIAAFLYVFHMDAGFSHSLFSPGFAQTLPFEVSVELAHRVQLLSSLGLGTLPCLYFTFLVLRDNHRPQQVYFVVGATVFCVLFSIGSHWSILYQYYYAGSIVTAICWIWGVFRNINEMKGQAGALIDELQYRVQLNKSNASPDIEKLLLDIETLSDGDLELYKLRVREIMNRLTEAQILAGGYSQEVIARNAEQTSKVTQSVDLDQIGSLVREQIAEVSEVLSDRSDKNEHTIEQTKSYIAVHYASEIDIDQLASKAGISRSYLMRLFKRAEGITINQYLTETRIEQAKVLLESLSVTDTAFAVGFNNSNYFGSVFKKATGQSPSQYQSSIQGSIRS